MCWIALRGLLWLDVCRPDHLTPLLSSFGDELGIVAGRACKDCSAHVNEPGPQLRIRQSRINLLIESVNDESRRARRRSNAVNLARLVAWHEIAAE
jgi:hypothetical protein